MFRTITAKFATKCKRCNGCIEVGERMRYGGYGRTYHFADDCPKPKQTDDDMLVGTKDDIVPANVTIVGTKDNGVYPTKPKPTPTPKADSLAGRF